MAGFAPLAGWNPVAFSVAGYAAIVPITVRKLILDALQEIGAYDPVDPLDEQDAAVGLRVLQMMVDTMQADGLLLFQDQHGPFSLVANQATNTLGPGGQFNTDLVFGANAPRPVWIGPATVTPVGDSIEYPLTPYASRADYYYEPDKTLTDLWPRRFLYEPSFPVGLLTWWPVPTTAAKVNLSFRVPLTVPATLDTEISLPPGYSEAWLYNLARRLWRRYHPLMPLPQDLKDDARLALGIVRRLNDPGPPEVPLDRALTGGGGYDIRSNTER